MDLVEAEETGGTAGPVDAGPSRIVVVLDFDGVLHSYTSGWTGPEPCDAPEPGARQFVDWLLGQGVEAVVVSARAGTEAGAAAIRGWLAEHGFPPLRVTSRKVPAAAYVDDRAVPYGDGRWDACRAGVARLVARP